MKPLVWVALASGPVAVGLWVLASWSPGLVEAVYSRGIYAWLSPWVSRFFALVPFAVAPWLLAGLLVAGIACAFLVPKGWLVGLAGLSAVVAWFVLGWGLNYQRQSWAVNMGWTVRGGSVAELQALAETMVVRTAALREAAWTDGAPDWVALSSQPIPAAYARAAQRWPLLAGSRPAPKAAPIPSVWSSLGIGGIFLPFTGEPLVNRGPAGWSLPFVAAHESAHLRGWAREDEANFLAFLVLEDSGDPRLEYSAWSMALLYVATALQEQGPPGIEAWKAAAFHLPETVKADWKAYFAYWDRFRGPVQTAAQAVNDTYLKAQGQADGVRSYGRMVDLLLAWETGPGPEKSSPRP